MQTTANDEIKIRTATPEDAEALAAIYAPYVENTSITFDTRFLPWRNSPNASGIPSPVTLIWWPRKAVFP